MPTLKRCKLAWYVAGSPKLAFPPLVQPHAHASTTISPRPGCGCMCPACDREQIAYSSRLRRLETAHTDPEAMQPRLIRSRLA